MPPMCGRGGCGGDAVLEPMVSVITPTFNSGRYVRKAITSVQTQTYENWEMIVVDDCSTDDTCDIVEEIARRDPRVKLYRQTVNSGAGSARTLALEKSKGRFVAYLD